MPSFSIFGPSQCSAAYKIYSDAVYKDKNINSHQDYLDRVDSDPFFGRVISYVYRKCHVNGHKDWEFLYL